MTEPKFQTEVNHVWNDIGDPLVCRHSSGVSFFRGPGLFGEQPGYCLQLQPHHIPKVEELLAELKALEVQRAIMDQPQEVGADV